MGPSNQLAERNMDGLQIPNLKGMGLKDAVFLLENAGLEVETRGVGKVKRQSVKAGKKVSKGTRIKLVLG
jgi:cell division protein FtsI (penicillin-binding protein 3)